MKFKMKKVYKVILQWLFLLLAYVFVFIAMIGAQNTFSAAVMCSIGMTLWMLSALMDRWVR